MRSGSRLECSFCGKSHREVKKLIAGPTVYICNECVGLCNTILSEEGIDADPPANKTPNLPAVIPGGSLGRHLFRHGFATSVQLAQAVATAEHTSETFEQVLERMGVLSQDAMRTLFTDELDAEPDPTSIDKFINLVMLMAIRQKVRHLFFMVEESTFRIRSFVNGGWSEMISPPLSFKHLVPQRIRALCTSHHFEDPGFTSHALTLTFGGTEVFVETAFMEEGDILQVVMTFRPTPVTSSDVAGTTQHKLRVIPE